VSREDDMQSREDDMQSVTSQSSAADSEAASDQKDLSNGHNVTVSREPLKQKNRADEQAPTQPPICGRSGSNEFDALFASAKSSSSRASVRHLAIKQEEIDNTAAVQSQSSMEKVKEEVSSNKRTAASRTAAKKASIGIALIASLSPQRDKSRSPSPPPRTRARSPTLMEPKAECPPSIARSGPPPRKPPTQRKALNTDGGADKTGSSNPLLPPNENLPKTRRGTAKAPPPLPRPPSPDDLDLDFPKRVIPVERRGELAAKRGATGGSSFKRKIFKSRAARAPAPIPESGNFDTQPESGGDVGPVSGREFRASPEPPRVPPVSKHFVELGRSGSRDDEGEDFKFNLPPDKPSSQVRSNRSRAGTGPCLGTALNRIVALFWERSR
jgi:hypothetical protein